VMLASFSARKMSAMFPLALSGQPSNGGGRELSTESAPPQST
jgi:hypothetical protein